MFIIRCFLMLFIFFVNFNIWAQNLGTAEGLVLDSLKQEILYGATVQVDGQGADIDYATGAFKMELPAGKHILEVSFIGYDKKRIPLEIQENKTTKLKIELLETITLLGAATVSTTKFKKELGEVTVSLEIISPKLIENTNAVSVDRAIEKVPGVNIMDGQVDIRGGSGYAQGTGSRVLLLMDDMPVLQADAGLAHWRDIPTENLAQIEVLKGAASTLYGSSAMNGVINIRTAYPTAKPYTKVTSFGTFYMNPRNLIHKWWTAENAPFETGFQFAHRQKLGKLDLVMGSNIFYNSSYMRGGVNQLRQDSLPGYDRKGRMTVNTRYQVSDKFSIGLNTNFNLGAQNQYLFWSLGLDRGLYESEATTTPIRGKNMRITVDPFMTYFDNLGNRHRINLRYYHINNDNEYNQSNRSNQTYGEYQYQRSFSYLGNLELSAGAVGSYTAVEADVYGDYNFSIGNIASYLQLDKKFFNRLNLSLGIRFEMNNMNSPDSVEVGNEMVVSPNGFEVKPILRFGANYKVTEGTFFRASWGQGYRYPTLLERYISTSAGFLGIYPNPSLKSETGWSAEVGIKQGFKISNWQGFLDIAGFWTEFQNMMEFTFVAQPSLIGFQVLNIGDTRITGIDFSIVGRGKIGKFETDLMAGYTYINPVYQNFEDSLFREQILSNSSSEENVLKHRFRHTVKFDAQTTYKKFSIGASLQVLSAMEAIDGFLYRFYPSIFQFYDEHQNGNFLFHARIACALNKHVKISVLGQNLLNSEYSMRPGILEAPRNITFRADFTF